MKALILAAGMGNRLGDITTNKPKALVEVAGKCLIDRVVEFAKNPQISEIGIVGGYQYNLLEQHLSSKNYTLFNNTNYTEGNILTLETAKDFFDDDVLMLNVDHIYPKEFLDHIIDNVSGISAMCDYDRQLGKDDMKVKTDGSGKLLKISKELIDFDAGYIGMTFCSKEMNSTYKEAITETTKIYGNSSCVEFVLGHLAANNAKINICDTSGFRWLEVDTPEELKHADNELSKG